MLPRTLLWKGWFAPVWKLELWGFVSRVIFCIGWGFCWGIPMKLLDIICMFGDTELWGWGLLSDEPRRSKTFEDACPLGGGGASSPMLRRSDGSFLRAGAEGAGSQATSKMSISAGFLGFSSIFGWLNDGVGGVGFF